jgi:hypothetical protein
LASQPGRVQHHQPDAVQWAVGGFDQPLDFLPAQDVG